jgi:putative sterol carrier protein
MTMSELFESLANRLNPAVAASMNKTLQWKITGDDTGVWAFQIENGVGHLIPGGVELPDITFTLSDTDWLAIAEGRQDAMKAFMSGKLKVDGNMMLAMKVPQLFPVGR